MGESFEDKVVLAEDGPASGSGVAPNGEMILEVWLRRQGCVDLRGNGHLCSTERTVW